MRTNLIVVGLGFACAIVGGLSLLARTSWRLQRASDPHHIVCYLPGAQLVNAGDAQHARAVYQTVFELDASQAPSFGDGDNEITLTTGQTVHLRLGNATCFALPLSPSPPPSLPKVAAPDAGPAEPQNKPTK